MPLGNPKYKRGDKVNFRWKQNDETIEKCGEVYIVDVFGTFFQTKEASYDIMVTEGENKILYKHIPETLCYKAM